MNISTETLLTIIGTKEVELIVLRQQLAELQKRIAELEKPKDATPA